MAQSEYPFTSGYDISADGQNNAHKGVFLGEVRFFALSTIGAVTKATLQAGGWAICDGTTPAAQGISSADITAATPDLQDQFIRMSNDESSGGTGGSDTHTLITAEMPAHTHEYSQGQHDGSGSWGNDLYELGPSHNTTSTGGGTAHNNIPAYTELVFFIKVKLTID